MYKTTKTNGNGTGNGTKRKDNPDYEKASIMTRDGVKQTVYRLKSKKEKPKKQVGTPQKRRGGFKKQVKKDNGSLSKPPPIASSMAKPITSYSTQVAQKKAMYHQDTLEKISDKEREKMEGEYKAPKQIKSLKMKSRTAQQ